MSAQTNAVQWEIDVTFLTQASPAHEFILTAAVMNPVVDDLCDDVMEGVSTDISFTSAVTQQNVSFPPTSAEWEATREFSFLSSHDASHIESNICSSTINRTATDLSHTVLMGISCKVWKT